MGASRLYAQGSNPVLVKEYSDICESSFVPENISKGELDVAIRYKTRNDIEDISIALEKEYIFEIISDDIKTCEQNKEIEDVYTKTEFKKWTKRALRKKMWIMSLQI